MIKLYTITYKDGTSINFYHKNIEEAWKFSPNAIDIKECEEEQDFSYMKYIEYIKAHTDEILLDYRGN